MKVSATKIQKKIIMISVFLGCCITLYQACTDDTLENPALLLRENWCRTFSNDEVDVALETFAKRYPDEDFAYLNSMNIQDIGQIVVIEDDGTFSGGIDGVLKTSQKFYNTHPDRFDFLCVYTTFNIPGMENAFAWHVDVTQEVRGIGADIVDRSEWFGSSGFLKGFQLMNSVHVYPDDPDQKIGTLSTYEVLAHEATHQWAAHLKFKDAFGNISWDLLGVQYAHWSYCFHGDQDFLYGHDWQDNGDGSFLETGACEKIGILTLYAMGLVPASEVPPFLFIENADVDCIQYCTGPGYCTGTPRTLTINNILDALGPRIPNYSESQKKFNMAFVLVTAPGDFPPSDYELQKLETIRQNFPARFSEWTLGRGTMDTNLSTLEPPSNLRITNVINDRSFLDCEKIIALEWDSYINDQLHGYNIYGSSNPKGTFVKLCGPLTGNTCRIDRLNCSKDYVFRITAVLSSGEESMFSNMTDER